MPTVVETPVEAYAFCVNGQCLGYSQEKVQGIRTHTDVTYLDMGGDMPGIEKSFDAVRFAEEADSVCSHCEGPREISEQVRPEYPNISGHDPMGLFEFKGKTEGELRELRHAAEISELKRDSEVKDLRAELAELKALLATKAAKPGPKAG